MTSKTEKPTPKKKKDASKQGQVWRSNDIASLLSLAGMTAVLTWAVSLAPVMRDMLDMAAAGFTGTPSLWLWRIGWRGAKILLIVYGFAIVFSIVPSLLMSGFTIGTEVFRLDFSAISPIAGFKRIFNIRSLKDTAKACVYFVLFILAAAVFWHNHYLEILTLAQNPAPAGLARMLGLLATLAYYLCAATLLLALADMLITYFLYLKELKMTRSEVTRENKDNHGSQEIKQERKRLAHDLLSAEVKRDIEDSTVVLANPTHIAIGLYLNPEVAPRPFVSVVAADHMARAVIAYARKMGVPVVRNIMLARRLFASNKRYTFVADDCMEDIIDVLRWLIDMENARRESFETASEGLPTTEVKAEPVSGKETETDVKVQVDAKTESDGIADTASTKPETRSP